MDYWRGVANTLTTLQPIAYKKIMYNEIIARMHIHPPLQTFVSMTIRGLSAHGWCGEGLVCGGALLALNLCVCEIGGKWSDVSVCSLRLQ